MGRLTSRRIVIALGGLVAIAACRDVVEPSAIDEVSSVRMIEVSLEGAERIEAFELELRVEYPAPPGGSSAIQVLRTEASTDGFFRFGVPRGTDALGDLRFVWLFSDDSIAAYTFENVSLATRRIELDLELTRVTGDVVLPVELVPGGIEGAQVYFFSLDQVDAWPTTTDANGHFETLMPAGTWRLSVDYPPDIASGYVIAIEKYDVVVGEGLRFEEPLVQRWLRVRVPEGFPDRRLLFRSDDRSGENRFRSDVSNVFTPMIVGERAFPVWVYDGRMTMRWFFSVDDDANLDWIDLPTGDIFSAVAVEDTVEVSVGDHLVRVEVRRDGLPVEVVMAVRGEVGSDSFFTSSEGWVDLALPEGDYHVEVVAGEDAVQGWIEADASHTVRVDLSTGEFTRVP